MLAVEVGQQSLKRATESGVVSKRVVQCQKLEDWPVGLGWEPPDFSSSDKDIGHRFQLGQNSCQSLDTQ